MIYTDGYGVSVQFINKNNVEKENNKKLNIKKAKEVIKEKCKNKTEEEIKKIKDKIEQEKIKKEMKEKYKSNKNNKNENKEFKYLEDLNDKDFNVAYKNYVVIDPGKRVIYKILQRTEKGNKFMSYSYRQRLQEIGKVKMNKQLKKYKNKTDIEK